MLTKIYVEILKIDLLFFRNLFHNCEVYRAVSVVPDKRYKYKYKLVFSINFGSTDIDKAKEVYSCRYNKGDYSKYKHLLYNDDLIDSTVREIEDKILKNYSECFN